MVTKNQKKLIRSLKLKKNRKTHRLFVAEGIKVINEFLEASMPIESLYCLAEAVNLFPKASKKTIQEISLNDLKQLSFLSTPQKAIALFKIPLFNNPNPNTELQLALDDVKDPGNLGTIIRLCDWFGINQLICSENTVDCFNPKVIQATMGSIARVNITYTNLINYIKQSSLPVFGTFMNGENIYTTPLPSEGILVMGNEANGISPTIESLTTTKINIPRFGTLQKAESLNVATATSILLSEFKSNLHRKEK